MFQIYARHPDYRGLIILPNPEFGDFVRTQNSLSVKRDMFNNVQKTHIVRNDKYSFEFSFFLTRDKSLEFLEFVRLYSSELMKVITYAGNEHIVYLQINPLELEKIGKATNVEEVSIQLRFEEP